MSAYYDSIRSEYGRCSFEVNLYRDKILALNLNNPPLIECSSSMYPVLRSPWLRVGVDVFFTKSIDSCVLGSDVPSSSIQSFYDKAVDQALNTITRDLSNTFNKPFMFASGPKSGKTSILKILFLELKKLKKRVIFVSLQDLIMMEGENLIDAFLRTVSYEFLDPSYRGKSICCCFEVLESFLSHQGECIMLIDDLHKLGKSMRINMSKLLLDLFVDKANRFLVTTSEGPVLVSEARSFNTTPIPRWSV